MVEEDCRAPRAVRRAPLIHSILLKNPGIREKKKNG
jgi:hypothetical protein